MADKAADMASVPNGCARGAIVPSSVRSIQYTMNMLFSSLTRQHADLFALR